jgi:hypothetical protein
MAKPATGPEKHSPPPQAAPEAPRKGAKAPAAPLEGMCHGEGCKAKAQRYEFCAEHYEQFKFGLINKLGRHVPDYEKKWEHYQAYKAKLSKVA